MDEADRTVREIADELYALPPQAFTATRATRVAAARSAGDRTTAAALARMKRPSTAGWLVNLVALRRPELVAELIDLGETIRTAQGNVALAQLRDLSAQRRRVLDQLIAQAQSLAAEQGVAAPARQHLAEAESTLSAAMADEDTARLVRSGRVLKALAYSGFGQMAGVADQLEPTGPAATGHMPVGQAPTGQAATGRAPSRQGTTGHAPTGRAPSGQAPSRPASAAEAARADAEAEARRARDALADTVRSEQEANERAEGAADEIAQLRERLRHLQRLAYVARQARIEAERALASAERRLRRNH